MEQEVSSKVLGERLRKFRIGHGWSQAYLAEKANTSSQNISKLEREGIKSTDDIVLYSKLLGTDLWKNEIDNEGPVGEIGMEILIELVKSRGYLGFGELITKHLHGLNQDQAVNEVMKLMNIGLCVREIYTDFDDVERDALFLTAKGLITVRNKISNPLIVEEIKEGIKKVKTYEQALEGASNYQDYFDSRPLEKRIRSLQTNDLRRFDYFLSLKVRFEYSDHRQYISIENYPNKEEGVCMFPAVNFTTFIINAMILGLNRENIHDFFEKYRYHDHISNYVGPYKNTYKGDLHQTTYESDNWSFTDDGRLHLSEKQLKELSERLKAIGAEEDDEEYIPFGSGCGLDPFAYLYPWLCDVSEEEHNRMMKDAIQDGALDDAPEFAIPEKSLEALCKENYMKLYKKTGKTTPAAMFTYEEYEAYIKENIRPAETEKEKDFDKELLELNRLYPETLDYFDFPKEWEVRGLADYVRSVYGIDTLSKE